ncbi:MAG: T9SS type A sorting domain-containing protein [Bacteroidota bacterium]
MKRRVFTFIIIFSWISISKAQPNGGFEDWTNEFSYEVPNGWQTLNFMSLLTPPNPVSAFKAIGVDKRSGNFALKLKTVYFNNIPQQIEIDDSVGGTYTGKITYSPPSDIQGFSYSGRPEKLEFWFKYYPVGNDVGKASFLLQKWNGSGHDTIAFASMPIAEATSYTLFQLTPTYYSTEIPDTASIGFSSSMNTSTARLGTTLYIDDLTFSGWVGVDEQHSLTGKVKIFPNPATDNVNICTSIKEANEIKVFDSFGKLEGIYKIQDDNININTCLFSSGIYLYDINDKKENILFKGKFTVVK